MPIMKMFLFSHNHSEAKIPLDDVVELKDGMKLVLDCVSKDRLIIVQMTLRI